MDRTTLSPLLRSFERHLRAENRSVNTVESYLESVRQAERYLTTHGRTLLDARRGDLEAFLAELLTRRAPGTVATRYKVLRLLYRWLEEEGEIESDPMAHMKPPIVPDQPVPVVAEDTLQRLLSTGDLDGAMSCVLSVPDAGVVWLRPGPTWWPVLDLGWAVRGCQVGWVAAWRAHQRAGRRRAGPGASASGRAVATGSTTVAWSSRSRSPVIDPSSASAVTSAACASMTRALTPGATVA
jgi:Phage integrase, N-terminal SAM-like domain